MHWDRPSRVSLLQTTDRHSPRSTSILARSSTPSPTGSHTSDLYFGNETPKPTIVLGICALDMKARSKAMREILTRLVDRARGAIEVKVFGDKVILDEDVQNWPRCDVLISFFSKDFPLDKAISYVKLRRPCCINELVPQALLWDRRLVGRVLDHIKVPTPKRLEVSRDEYMKAKLGVELGDFQVTPEVLLREDGNAYHHRRPSKPVSGEDHNVYIYFRDGGGRRLFRKVGNKSSEPDPGLMHPRTDGSYIYEEFIDVDNSEDIKVYTVGKEYTHAETRKSPVVDGVVRRNTDGKEIRFITRLNDEEKSWAAKICDAFGQRVCGYDMLRCDNGARSQVIDVNGWSFVKGNESYYDKAAEILSALCIRISTAPDRPLINSESAIPEVPTWLLKANVTVFRHADRTPKQKLKFNFPIGEAWTQPFVTLLNGEKEEIILREREQLTDGEDLTKLTLLNNALFSKIELPGTKAQLKPVYSKKAAGYPRKLVKLTLVFKWGGEFTHSAHISIMNKDVLNNVKIYTSSERRHQSSLSTSSTPTRSGRSSTDGGPGPTITPKSSMSLREPLKLIVRKDLLDDSNAAKDLMDDVKKRLKILLRPGESEKRPELIWPKSMNKEPVEVLKEVIELLSGFRAIMGQNFDTLEIEKIQERWCCGDEPWLFRERWEKLFEDFCDVKPEKFDPSRVTSSRYRSYTDTIKYCALHHRTFLFAIFDENGGQDHQHPRDPPQEYGIEPEEKDEIGVLTSLPLLRKVVEDLEEARNHGGSSLTCYFTKESHIHTLVNLVLLSGLPIANRRMPELDYALYERNYGRSRSDKEYSIKLSLSEGAHSSNVLDSALDARHSLNVQQRRKLTQHLPYSLVIEKLSKHFGRTSEDDDTGPETPLVLAALPAKVANESSRDDP
ncbi:cortical actin cytoskeleton protein asp1 [Lactarius akahatsu]|uniref:Inositol hexakisphosphate and diphosphoinositol-pentakisphosphate kinase n=1 Tax=Lactarius akahatsu TaxID=416441 RepID=A0AAD4QH33_9AGAM|nr:cortical actin cytoskeleton protein asp1 [Lactarius akahatsu]